MCGIAGIVCLDGRAADARTVDVMLDQIRHRGPNDSGVHNEGPVGIGNVRLSIIDLSDAGHQPMVSANGRYAITYNGEIFNYLELRAELENRYHFRTRTDTEVLLAAYATWGEECLHRLNGMFAFLIHDRKTGRVFGARDRYGVKPFYYTVSHGTLYFGSEIRALVAVMEDDPLPNDRVVHDYLVFKRTDQSAETFVEGIQSLLPGHVIEVQGGTVRLRRWYDLTSAAAPGFASPNEYRELLNSAVRLRLRSDVPVGVCLSGGLDSSSIASIIISDYPEGELRTFSAAYRPGQTGDESYFREPYRGLCTMRDTYPTADSFRDDLEDFVAALEEPVPSLSPYAQYKVMELASREVTVLLDGQGADEQLGGYHYFFGYYFAELLRNLRFATLIGEGAHYLRRHRSGYGLGTLGFFMLPASVRTHWQVRRAGHVSPDLVRLHGSSDVLDRLYGSRSLRDAAINHFEYKLQHLLKWEDRNSMWFSVEARVPFLDYRLVERTIATDSAAIIRKGTTKHILREAMRGTLPERIRTRGDKLGFATPEAEWVRTASFQEVMNDAVASDRLERYFDMSKLARLQRSHSARQKDLSAELWKAVNLELWFRYLDGLRRDRRIRKSNAPTRLAL